MLRARRLTRPLISAAVALACTFTAATARGASLFDPALKFRVLRTEHFRIYFHQGEDRLAMRLSAIAEDAWRALERPLGVRPPRLTHAIANGLYVASPNRIGHEDEPGTDGITFFGHSFIADPFGRYVAQAGESEEVVIARCDPALIESVRRNWPFLRDRRVDAYGPILNRYIGA